MKKIGSGWQYNVYKISETRVRKIELSWWRRFLVVIVQSLGDFKEVSAIRERLIASLIIVQKLTARNDFDQHLFGNVTFVDGTSFEQDNAIPLGKYFAGRTFAENCRVVDGHVQLIVDLWRFGVADRVFSATINAGVSNDRVILLDIGELTDSKESVEHAIEIKRWEWAMDYRMGFLFRPKLRRYYRNKMNEFLTIENLEKHWNKSQ